MSKIESSSAAIETNSASQSNSNSNQHNQSEHQSTANAVGVYERAEKRGGLSLPLLIVLVLATLVSVALSARFLF
jgi:hypothetical protein